MSEVSRKTYTIVIVVTTCLHAFVRSGMLVPLSLSSLLLSPLSKLRRSGSRSGFPTIEVPCLFLFRADDCSGMEGRRLRDVPRPVLFRRLSTAARWRRPPSPRSTRCLFGSPFVFLIVVCFSFSFWPHVSCLRLSLLSYADVETHAWCLQWVERKFLRFCVLENGVLHRITACYKVTSPSVASRPCNETWEK